ncbi:hypothetical protein ACYSNU_12090 [Enterococcus sp. LJL120]
MRNRENKRLIAKIERFLQMQNHPMNDLLYALVQLDLGLYQPEADVNGREVYVASNFISKEDAQVFFKTLHKDEFVKAFNKKNHNKLAWEPEQKEWNEAAYLKFCNRFSVKP